MPEERVERRQHRRARARARGAALPRPSAGRSRASANHAVRLPRSLAHLDRDRTTSPERAPRPSTRRRSVIPARGKVRYIRRSVPVAAPMAWSDRRRCQRRNSSALTGVVGHAPRPSPARRDRIASGNARANGRARARSSTGSRARGCSASNPTIRRRRAWRPPLEVGAPQRPAGRDRGFDFRDERARSS